MELAQNVIKERLNIQSPLMGNSVGAILRHICDDIGCDNYVIEGVNNQFSVVSAGRIKFKLERHHSEQFWEDFNFDDEGLDNLLLTMTTKDQSFVDSGYKFNILGRKFNNTQLKRLWRGYKV